LEVFVWFKILLKVAIILVLADNHQLIFLMIACPWSFFVIRGSLSVVRAYGSWNIGH
jgi:hypothetical protein